MNAASLLGHQLAPTRSSLRPGGTRSFCHRESGMHFPAVREHVPTGGAGASRGSAHLIRVFLLVPHDLLHSAAATDQARPPRTSKLQRQEKRTEPPSRALTVIDVRTSAAGANIWLSQKLTFHVPNAITPSIYGQRAAQMSLPPVGGPKSDLRDDR